MRVRLVPILLAFLICVPVLEVVVFFLIGGQIGFWQTVALVLIAGAVGSALARSQARRVWGSIQRDLAEGRTPDQGLLDGVLVLAAGALLILPGFLTDIAGLLLLIPAVRLPIKALLRRKIERMIVYRAASVDRGFTTVHDANPPLP